MMSQRRSQKSPSPSSMPRIFGTCLIEITRASPVTNPTRTEGEKNCASTPRRKSPASTMSPPTSRANAAVSSAYSGVPAVARAATAPAESAAWVAETTTISLRELAKIAYRRSAGGAT